MLALLDLIIVPEFIRSIAIEILEALQSPQSQEDRVAVTVAMCVRERECVEAESIAMQSGPAEELRR